MRGWPPSEITVLRAQAACRGDRLWCPGKALAPRRQPPSRPLAATDPTGTLPGRPRPGAAIPTLGRRRRRHSRRLIRRPHHKEPQRR